MTTSDHAITITEAAKRLSVSSRTIERMIKAKKLQAFRAGAGRGVWRIWPAALDLAFAPEQDQPANAAGKRIKPCLSANGVSSGTSTSSRRMAHELDTLLAQRTKRRPKSITTS
jgi:excisionase family DNA binding protein